MAKKKKRRRGFPLFYTIYWTLVIAAIGAIGYGSWYLWNLCADYEAAQPKYVAEPYQKIYTDGEIERMIELSGGGIELNEFETAQDYVNYVRNLLAGKEITCTPAYTSDDNQKLYVAKADGAKFSNFTLKKTAQQSKFGFDLWEFDRMTLDLPAPEETYTAQILSNYKIYINGMELSDSYITQRDIPTFASGKLPSNIYTPTFNVYTFTSHFGVPDISVRNEAGEEGVLVADEDSQTGWHMELQYSDDEMKGKMEDFVLKAAKAYATFVSEDSTRANVLKYVMKGSKAADYINAYDNDWFTPHSKYSFSHEVTHNYYRFADNCFSVEVQMLFHMSASNGKQQNYPCVYRLYWALNKDSDKWLIFDYELLNEYDEELHWQVDAQK